MHYLTADLHLGHARILDEKYDNRPFPNIEVHDETIVGNLVPELAHRGFHNELWILGDVAFSVEKLEFMFAHISKHWQAIHLIRGNHDDKVAWRRREMFHSYHEAKYVRFSKDVRAYLSHYAHRVWRNSHHGSLHFHGHSHGHLPPWGKSIDVGIMNHNFRPMSLETGIRLTADAPVVHHHKP